MPCASRHLRRGLSESAAIAVALPRTGQTHFVAEAQSEVLDKVRPGLGAAVQAFQGLECKPTNAGSSTGGSLESPLANTIPAECTSAEAGFCTTEQDAGRPAVRGLQF